jgi:N-methylhydantoinase B
MPLNPVAFQVLASRLSGIVQEMQDNIFRTGYSTIVRESQDASCVLLDPTGAVIGEHVIYAFHLTCLGAVVRAVQRDFGGDIRPGDAYLTNHPYLAGVTHAMDIAVLTPAFSDGELIAWCGSIAHKSDLGGIVPGTAYGNAREIFHEGVQYPPVRFERDFRIIPDIEAILRANSRTPDIILGDIRGQVGVGRLGERRLRETIARYGRDNVLAAFEDVQDVAEARLRSAIAGWSDGTSEAEGLLDRAPGEVVRFHVRIDKRGDRIHFDFSDSDDQVIQPVNTHPPVALGALLHALISMVDPSLTNNGGVTRSVEATFRLGSVLNPRYPAPTNSYMPTVTMVTEICLRALAAFAPERRIADCSLPGGTSIGGLRADGTGFLQYEMGATASGARAGSDGPSATSTLLANVSCTPIEIAENEFPTRVIRFELVPDSGGAGEFRGGLAPRRVWQILSPTAQITVRAANHEVPAQPLDGGSPGRVARFVVNPGTDRERAMGSLFSGLELQAGDVILQETGGGAGIGNPRRRDPARVRQDVIDGYVTPDAALSIYGLTTDPPVIPSVAHLDFARHRLRA